MVALLAISTYYTRTYEATADDLMPGLERGIDYSRAAFKEQAITVQHILKLNKIMPGVISVSIPIRGKAPIKVECGTTGAGLDCHDPEKMGAQGILNDADVLGDIEKLEQWMRSHSTSASPGPTPSTCGW